MLRRRLAGFRIFPTLLFILVIAFGSIPASADDRSPALSTISVNIFIDEYNDTNTGCSLREAIRAANGNTSFGGCDTGSSGADIILLPAGTYTLTRTGADEDSNVTGDLDVLEDLTIRGAGQDQTTINAAALVDRILDVDNNRTLEIEDLTLTGGSAQDGTSGVSGGPGYSGQGGGAIFAAISTTVSLSHVTIISNHSGNGGFGSTPATPGTTGGGGGSGGNGGGIYVYSGTLNITDSLFSENNTGGGGSGANGTTGSAGSQGGSGGYGNSAGFGGAIAIGTGTLNVNNTMFVDNATGGGGNGGPGGSGGNGSYPGGNGGNGGGGGNGGQGGDGGAIYSEALTTITNSTFQGNSTGMAGSAGAAGAGGAGALGLTGTGGTPAGSGGNGGNGGQAGSTMVAGNGAAICTRYSALTVLGSTFVENGTGGGGIGGNGGDGGSGGSGGSSGGMGAGGQGGSGGIGGSATGGGTGGDGGAIRHWDSSQAVTIRDSTFEGNMTGSGRSAGTGGSGGFGGNGGNGLGTPGGSGGAGGRAAYISGGGGSGGAGAALSLGSHGTVNLINDTFSGNRTGTSASGADGGNGGNGGDGGTGSVEGNGGAGGNAGSGGDGGASGNGAAIALPYYYGTENPALSILFNTIVLNTISIPSGSGGLAGAIGVAGIRGTPGSNGLAGYPGDAPLYGHGGGISRSVGTVAIGATILAGNLAGSSYQNCYSAYMNPYSSQGWNLFEDPNGTDPIDCPVTDAEDDKFDVDPVDLHLGTLQVNGRGPATHALLDDSIAIDWVQPGEAGCQDTVMYDARGISREIVTYLNPNPNMGCDVGAFEYGNMGYLPILIRP